MNVGLAPILLCLPSSAVRLPLRMTHSAQSTSPSVSPRLSNFDRVSSLAGHVWKNQMVGGYTDLAPLAAVGIDPLLSVSLASGIGSLRPLYEAWKAGNLTTSMLLDVPGTGNIGKFFSATHGLSLSVTPRSCLSSLWKVLSVPGSPSLLQASSGLSGSPTSGQPILLSSSTSSRGSARTKRPLVFLRPRGDGGSPVVPGATLRSLSVRSVGITVPLLFIDNFPHWNRMCAGWIRICSLVRRWVCRLALNDHN